MGACTIPWARAREPRLHALLLVGSGVGALAWSTRAPLAGLAVLAIVTGLRVAVGVRRPDTAEREAVARLLLGALVVTVGFFGLVCGPTTLWSAETVLETLMLVVGARLVARAARDGLPRRRVDAE